MGFKLSLFGGAFASSVAVLCFCMGLADGFDMYTAILVSVNAGLGIWNLGMAYLEAKA